MCCCCNKRTGHLVVVWMALFYSAALFALMIVLAVRLFELPYGGFITGSVFYAIGIGICSLDIYGIRNNSTACMLPFLVWIIVTTSINGIGIAVSVVRLTMLTSKEFDSEAFYMFYHIYMAGILISLLMLILFAYFCHVILSHIKEVSAQKTRLRQQAGAKIHSHC